MFGRLGREGEVEDWVDGELKQRWRREAGKLPPSATATGRLLSGLPGSGGVGRASESQGTRVRGYKRYLGT